MSEFFPSTPIPIGICIEHGEEPEACARMLDLPARHFQPVTVRPEPGESPEDLARRIGERWPDLCGLVLMAKAPGGDRVAASLSEVRPDLPVERQARLTDPVLRENFISRVYVRAHWQRVRQAGLTHGALQAFHSRYKYQLMASDRPAYQRLGKLLGESGDLPLESLAREYFSQLMAALSQPATRGGHCNALQHIAGYLKRVLSPAERQELAQLIDRYRLGHVPLLVPLTLLREHFQRHPDAYIAGQSYLQPHPDELGLFEGL